MKTVLNDLYDYENMKIYQLDEGFKFSLDSILLAEFVKINNSNQLLVDFCTGNAVVPLIISTKYQNKIIGFEVQKPISKLAEMSVDINKKSNISIINDNVSNVFKYLGYESVNIITCNPPYFKTTSSSLTNQNKIKAIARHEVTISLAEIISIASKLLKNRGYFYLVHRTDRLEEILKTLNINNLNPKELQFIYYNERKESNLVLIKAIKNGSVGMKVLPPIFTQNLKSFQNIF